jgi:non-heme chloroperoxidase
VVPIDAAGRRAVKLCKKGTLKEFAGAPHALPTICVDEVNQELLKFLQS